MRDDAKIRSERENPKTRTNTHIIILRGRIEKPSAIRFMQEDRRYTLQLNSPESITGKTVNETSSLFEIKPLQLQT